VLKPGPTMRLAETRAESKFGLDVCLPRAGRCKKIHVYLAQMAEESSEYASH
jgi:hypothetical protein